MAAAMGKDGLVKFDSTADSVTYFDSWSLNPAIGTAEITSYGDSAKAFISTIREWTVTAGGTLDMSDTGQVYLMNDFYTTGASTTVTIYLYDRTTTFFSGTAYITGATINSQIGDKVSFTYTFQGTGALSYKVTTG